MSTVRFPSRVSSTVGACTVYLKQRWADDWEAVDYLYATQMVWAAAPEIPTATLRWNYGNVLRPGAAAFAAATAQSGKNRWYVKITQPVDTIEAGDNDPAPSTDDLEWYGIIDVDARDLWGTDAGDQTLTAFGLISLLDRHRIYKSVWLDDGSAEEFIVARGIKFNDVPESFTAAGNRTIEPGPNGHCFAQDRATASFWSSKDIVSYLLQYATPGDYNGDREVEFELVDSDNALPTWDKPRLDQHGKSTRSLLNQLMARQRLLSYRVEVSGRKVQIKPFTFTEADIDLGQIDGIDAEIRENPRQLIIGLDSDRAAAVGINLDTADSYDQVIARGARRRSVCSLSYVDTTLGDGWPSALETEYEAGASGAGDYPAAEEVEERQRRNTEARSADRLRQVFSRFVPPIGWDQTAGDGEGQGQASPVFPKDSNPAQSYPVYPDQLFMLPRLPLLRGMDYSGTKIDDGTASQIDSGPFDEMTPLVLFPLPDTSRWATIERYGEAGRREHGGKKTPADFSGSVRIEQADKGISVNIHGKHQHVIAETDFTPLDVDDIELVADYKDAIFTVAFHDDRYCEAKYPDPLAFFGEPPDELRILDLEAGDSFLLDYCVPDTVVGVNPSTGALIRSTSGGFINDDRPQLRSLAKLAWTWYSRTRRALSFRTKTITSELRIGDYVTQINETYNTNTVNTVITRIELDIPYSEGTTPEAPTFSVQTGFAEFDPLAAVPEGEPQQ